MSEEDTMQSDKDIEINENEACNAHLEAIHALYEQAKQELNQHGTSDDLLSFAANLEDQARQMAEILEKQRYIERKPDYSRDTPGIPYSMLIEYSSKELCYYVTLPEFIGYTNGRYINSGKTYEEAAKNGEESLAFLIDAAKQEGDELPKPAMVTYDEDDEDNEEWPTSWVVKRQEAELHYLNKTLEELEERIKILEQDVSLEQFCKGLDLFGHRLEIRMSDAKKSTKEAQESMEVKNNEAKEG